MTPDEQAERAFARTIERAERLLVEVEDSADSVFDANAELVSIIGYLVGMMDTIRKVAPSPEVNAMFEATRRAGQLHSLFRQDLAAPQPKANV